LQIGLHVQTADRSHKSDGLLGKNWLKGTLGDATHAILCGAGHNPRVILAHLRVLYFALVAQLA
jgi:IS5 family transposase